MRIVQNTLFRCGSIAICAVVMASGCIIVRGNLAASYTSISPAQYCPGDTITAAYDFLGTELCPADASCASFFPTVAVSSAPSAFPTRSITGFGGSLNFTAPNADTVSVTFAPDRDRVLIPTGRFDASSGNRIFVERGDIRNQIQTASRVTAFQRELVHEGMCAGAAPVNTSAPLPAPPQVSPNLRLTELCNVNTVTVVATLSGTPSGETHTETLAPGACLSTSAPGIPAAISSSSIVEIRPMLNAPGTRCSAAGPNVPPPTLRSLARMACR